MTEIHASLGIANLKYYDAVLKDRETKYKKYLELLSVNNNLSFQKVMFGKTNYSYFPVIFKNRKRTFEMHG